MPQQPWKEVLYAKKRKKKLRKAKRKRRKALFLNGVKVNKSKVNKSIGEKKKQFLTKDNQS